MQTRCRADEQPSSRAPEERRSKPRIYESFPATVLGMDGGGGVFEAATTIDNLSATGLYLRLPQRLEPGATLLVVVHLSVHGEVTGRVAIHGVVLRAELQPDGACGIALSFTNHKFL